MDKKKTNWVLASTRTQTFAGEAINTNSPCWRCGCGFNDHRGALDGRTSCRNCGVSCSEFMTMEQGQRLEFFKSYKWYRGWVKHNKFRKISRIRFIMESLGNDKRYKSNCVKCNVPTITNGAYSAAFAKKSDGLACKECRRCSSCCDCKVCKKCNVNSPLETMCKLCNKCNKKWCCLCKVCYGCKIECGDDYCRNCERCNDCCLINKDCLDINRVPFYTSNNRPPHFCKAPTLKEHIYNPTSRYIAAEIEVAKIRGHGRPIYNKVKEWGGAIVYDGTLPENGFEINTAPASGDVFVNQINDICKELKNQNAGINESCGLHIHIDARDLNYYDIRRLVRVYAAIENILFGMVPSDRHKSKYCQPCGERYLSAIEEGRLPYDKVKTDVIKSIYANDGSTKGMKHKKRQAAHYYALNLHSWFHRGTIECRMFNGTIDPVIINNWAIMWARIVDYAAKTDDDVIAKTMALKNFSCLAKILEKDSKIIEFVSNRIIRYGSRELCADMQDWRLATEKT